MSASTVQRGWRELTRGWHRLTAVWHHLGRAIGTDPRRLALFFGAISLYALYWRVDVFILDTFAMVNTVAALNRLQLDIQPIVFGTPGPYFRGTYEVGGQLFGRNYGLAVAAVPVLWAFRLLTVVAAPRLLLAGGWSLTILATGVFAGRALERPRTGRRLGASVALVTFAGNVALARPLPEAVLPLVSLQVVTILSAALLVVLMYEVGRTVASGHVGVFAGVATAVIGPIGFWAPIPKRHVVTATLAVIALLGLYRARAATSPDTTLGYRVVPYVAAALSAWVSAPEGLVLCVAVVGVDLLTAEDFSPRTVSTLGVVFGLSLLPFLLTNLLISGNPVLPPRMLTHWDGQPIAPAGPTGESAATSRTGTASEGPATGPAPAGSDSTGSVSLPAVQLMVETALAQLVAVSGVFVQLLAHGVDAIEPSRIYYVFVRSGHIPGVDYAQTGGETLELTLLESAPLLAVLGLLPLRLGRVSVQTLRALPTHLRSEPIRTTDLFALVYVSVFWVLYLPRLPLHSTITVRYLAPTVPILVYAVCRLRPVREVVTETAPLLAATAVASAVGLTAFFGLALAGASPGTAMQAHAVVNLAVATAVLGWGVAADRVRLDPRLGAVLLGTAIGVTAAFLLLSGVEYLGHGRQFALPLSRLFETLVPVR
jgi:hypothetical protein